MGKDLESKGVRGRQAALWLPSAPSSCTEAGPCQGSWWREGGGELRGHFDVRWKWRKTDVSHFKSVV